MTYTSDIKQTLDIGPVSEHMLACTFQTQVSLLQRTVISSTNPAKGKIHISSNLSASKSSGSVQD